MSQWLRLMLVPPVEVYELPTARWIVPSIFASKPTCFVKRWVGLCADDADLLGRVEAARDALHLRSLCVPVEQYRAEDELGVLVECHPGLLRRRVDGVLAHDPRHAHGHLALAEQLVPVEERLPALFREVRALAGVLGGGDHDAGVAVLPEEGHGGRGHTQDLERRLARERATRRLPRE